MLDLYNIVGSKEAAKLLGYKDNAFSMLKSRSNDFPSPVKELSATPLYRITDIKEWAEKHGKDLIDVKTINDNKITITITGEKNSGKSFISSVFIKNSIFYRKILNNLKEDFNQCIIKSCVVDNLEEHEEVICLKILPSRIRDIEKRRELNNIINSSDCIKSKLSNYDIFCDEVKHLSTLLNEHGFNINSICEISITAESSKPIKDLMVSLGINSIIVYDMPDISNINLNKIFISKSDLLLFILRNSNEEYISDYIKLVSDKLSPSVACSKVLFLMRTSESCDDENELRDMKETITKRMHNFKSYFKLGTDIIDSFLGTQDLENSIISVPVMKMKKLSLSEELFSRDLSNELNTLLTDKSFEIFKRNIKESRINSSIDEIKIIDNILSRLKINSKNGSNYFKRFCKEQHSICSSEDNYNVITCTDNARKDLLDYIFKVFSSIRVSEFPSVYEQEIIRYTYSVITYIIKHDIGIAFVKNYDIDDYYINLCVIESILARDLKTFCNVLDYNNYYKVLKNKGNISSKYLGLIDFKINKEYKFKMLDLISECNLDKLESNDLYQLVRNCYIYGLQKLGEYIVIETFLEMNNVKNTKSLAIKKVIEIYNKQIKKE